jgi:hypothetical protein
MILRNHSSGDARYAIDRHIGFLVRSHLSSKASLAHAARHVTAGKQGLMRSTWASLSQK